MVGFVNGLAIVIFLAQLKNFQRPKECDDDESDNDHHRRRLSSRRHLLSGGGGGDNCDNEENDGYRRLSSIGLFEDPPMYGSFSVLQFDPVWISGAELVFMLLNVGITMVRGLTSYLITCVWCNFVATFECPPNYLLIF